MICHGCKAAINTGEQTLKLSAGTLEFGKKSQQQFHSPDQEVDVVIHYRCVFFYFNPFADKEMYDYFYSRVANQIRREEIEQLKEVAFDEVASDISHLCPECRKEKEESNNQDTPPEEGEYACEHCGAPTYPQCPTCGETIEVVNVDGDSDEGEEETQYAPG